MRKKRKRVLLTCLTIFFVLLFCVSGYVLGKEIFERHKDQDNFAELEQMAQVSPDNILEGNVHIAVEGEDLTYTESEEHERNIALLNLENEECIGWIYIEGTRVNYPVMHTPAEPEKYLRRNFYGEYSVSGVPFMEGTCSLTNMHIILYGHNMRNDTMFADVTEYVDRDFRNEHPFIEFETEEGCVTYEVFAVALIDATDDWYFEHSVETQEQYSDKIYYIKGASMYETGIVPSYGERLLTLSTCYGMNEDGRLVVVAVERK